MTFHDNEIHSSERDEQRWSDWKPHTPALWPVRVGEVGNREA